MLAHVRLDQAWTVRTGSFEGESSSSLLYTLAELTMLHHFNSSDGSEK